MVACGVRKVWAKEFKDVEKPSDQVRRLRKMLTDLGMTGRMSLEQAKAIKAKREFEQELGADHYDVLPYKTYDWLQRTFRSSPARSNRVLQQVVERMP